MIGVETLNMILKSISKYNQQILMCSYGNKDIIKKIITSVSFASEVISRDFIYRHITLYYSNGERGVVEIEELIKILEEDN